MNINWFQQRVFSLIGVLFVPCVAATIISLPEEAEQKMSVQELPHIFPKALQGVGIEIKEDDGDEQESDDENATIVNLNRFLRRPSGVWFR